MPERLLGPYAQASAHLPGALRPAFHRSEAEAWARTLADNRRWLAVRDAVMSHIEAHTMLAAAFEPCEGTRGGMPCSDG